MSLNNRWKIILTAVAFNLLFEISLRGIRFFLVNPLLLVFIAPVYLNSFIIIEDLIGRFRLQDYQFMLVALIVWYASQLIFLSPDAFMFPGRQRLILGINWVDFLWLSLAWYIALQSLMAFYLANRLFPRKNYTPLLSKRGFILWVFLYLTTGIVWRIGTIGKSPFPNLSGFLVLFAITLALVVILKKTLVYPREIKLPSQRHRLMDFLCFVTISLFTYFSIFNSLNESKTSSNLVDYSAFNFQIIIYWSTILAIIIYGYRLISKKPIPI